MVLFTALLRFSDQGIILRIALLASYSGSVIRFRQLSRSSISPCEQVGEHHGGAGGCLASGDSGGIRGNGRVTGISMLESSAPNSMAFLMNNYWVVGAMFGGTRDKLPLFVERGYWYCWDPDQVRKREIPKQAQRLFPQIKKGDRLAVKKKLGRGSDMMLVRALGEVVDVDHDEWRIYVRWLVTDLAREVPIAGCMGSIHGPFSDTEWRSKVFCI